MNFMFKTNRIFSQPTKNGIFNNKSVEFVLNLNEFKFYCTESKKNYETVTDCGGDTYEKHQFYTNINSHLSECE